MNKLKVVKFGCLAMTAAVMLAPVFAFALPTPTSPVAGGGVDLTEIEAIINRVAQFLIIIGVVLAVIFIIWGGIAYMAAGGDETKSGAAKTRIWNGVIGAAVVLAVGVILQTLAGLITRTFFH